MNRRMSPLNSCAFAVALLIASVLGFAAPARAQLLWTPSPQYSTTAQLNAARALLAAKQAQLDVANATVTTDDSQKAALQAQVTALTAQVAALMNQSGGTGSALPPRMVFGHDLPAASPGYISSSYYASDQPSLIGQTPVDPVTYYTQALTAGFDGLEVDNFMDPTGMVARLPIGDQIGLKFMPVIDTATEGNKATAAIIQDAVSFGTTYGAEAADHASAFQYNGKYVIATYNDSAHLAANDWATVNQTLAANNVPVTFFFDVGGMYLSQGADAARQATLASFAAQGSLLYAFGPAANSDTQDALLEGLVGSGKLFAATVRPGYYKSGGTQPTGNPIGWEDSAGVQTFVTRWQAAEAESFVQYPLTCRFAFVSTWSDFSENSGIMPSTDMSDVFSQINAFFAAQFKGLPLPNSSVVQILIVQQSAYTGGSALMQCVIINGGLSRVYCHPVVQNCNSAAISGQFGGPCPPQSITVFSYPLADNTQNLGLTAINGVSAAKIYSTVSNDVTGQQILGADSARCVLYNTPAPSGGGQALYYAVPSSRFNGYSKPSGTLNISPSGVKTLSITPASGTVQLVELLHDTRRAFVSYGTGTVTNVVFSDLKIGADNRNDPADHGCYIVRQINTDGKVSYSDPLYVSHH